MRTLLAQSVTTVCLLVFGIVSLRVARRLGPGEPVFRYTWALTGCAFLMEGLNLAFHDAFSITAFVRGPESRAWQTVITLHPILNHSRTFLLIAFAVVLWMALVRARRGAPLPPLPVAVGVLVAGMMAGGAVGWAEGPLTLRHFQAVAVWDIVQLLPMLGALYVGLTSGGMDRGLWLCLSVHALVLSLSILLFAALAHRGVAGGWSPEPWQVQASKAAFNLAIVFLAVGQMAHVRRGAPLRGLLEPHPGDDIIPRLMR